MNLEWTQFSPLHFLSEETQKQLNLKTARKFLFIACVSPPLDLHCPLLSMANTSYVESGFLPILVYQKTDTTSQLPPYFSTP